MDQQLVLNCDHVEIRTDLPYGYGIGEKVWCSKCEELIGTKAIKDSLPVGFD
jgi:hypothetical protein